MVTRSGVPGGSQALGLLLLTHSSRETNLDRCAAATLRKRFGDPGRLDDLPPFETLSPARALYSGSVSFYRVARDPAGRLTFEQIGSVRDQDKIQHAVLCGERDLLVGYEHRVECWRLSQEIGALGRIGREDFSLQFCFEHAHLAGLHTVVPLAGDRILMSCSGSDSVLLWDSARGALARSFRMPESLYGRNYALTPEMDLRRHYIPDDYQTTHLNAAHVDRAQRQAVVSTLIQGAVGLFDLASGAYREVVRGIIGCHGARFSDRGEIYLADSPEGALIFLRPDGTVGRRFRTDSRWLHDVQQICGSVFAFALADSNELRIYDIDSEALLARYAFPIIPFEDALPGPGAAPAWLGNSTQALSYAALAGM